MSETTETSPKKGGRESKAPAPEKWVELYSQYLFPIAYKRTGDTSLARDFLQETYLRAMQGLDSFSGTVDFKFWLRGILNNVMNSHHRSESKWTQVDLGVHESDIVEARLSQHIDDELSAALEHCIEQLPERSRELFTMKHIEFMTQKEIAEATNLTESNISVILTRARKVLRDCLGWLLNLTRRPER